MIAWAILLASQFVYAGLCPFHLDAGVRVRVSDPLPLMTALTAACAAAAMYWPDLMMNDERAMQEARATLAGKRAGFDRDERFAALGLGPTMKAEVPAAPNKVAETEIGPSPAEAPGDEEAANPQEPGTTEDDDPAVPYPAVRYTPSDQDEAARTVREATLLAVADNRLQAAIIGMCIAEGAALFGLLWALADGHTHPAIVGCGASVLVSLRMRPALADLATRIDMHL